MTKKVGTGRAVVGMALGVLGVALAVNLVMALKLGVARPMASDALYFRDIAENLSVGQGYSETESFWMDTPAMSRLPGWPLVVAMVMKAAPGANADVVMRLTAVAVNSLAAALVSLLTVRLFRRPTLGAVAGVVYVLHPTGLYSTYTGLSEPLFVLLMVSGVLLVLWRRPWVNMAGFLLVGLACLVRPNYVLWGPAVAGIVGWLALRGQVILSRRAVAVGIIGVGLTFVPVFTWALRNYTVCGHFPVISSLQGEVFYGGNNPVVATNRAYWGYWVFPDSIPGETPKGRLAARMSEYEVNRYYMRKGREFMRENAGAMPMLWVGKLVRAFVPVPWKRTLETLVVSAYRWVLYIAAIVAALLMWRQLDMRYRVALVSLLAATVATVLWFWGCARFAFAVEPFLIPLAVGLAARWRGGMSLSEPSGT